MLDCVGKELNIGDKVICADSRYADLLIGEVVKLTPQKVLVRYHRSEYGKEYTNEKLKEPYQIFKYTEVIRCKDCNHWWKENETCKHPKCCEAWMCVIQAPKEHYCSYGERKDNDL